MLSPLGLYLHIPFCAAKCSYCHFAIDPGPTRTDRQERYLRALWAEVEAVAEAGRLHGLEAYRTNDGRLRVDTVYFGGGTPSQLAPELIHRTLDVLRSHFALDPEAEVTLEANPGDWQAPAYRELVHMGANRLSLGGQSMSTEVLVQMGRDHGPTAVVAAVEMARSAGLENVSLDVILGWSGETESRWRRTLDGVLGLDPEHVSLYLLEVSGKTLLTHQQTRGRLALPDDDLVADLYQWSVGALEQNGLGRYEISNFARAGWESRHNRKYWTDAPYLGFGMSAHSYVGGRRWWNLGTYASYCRAVETSGGTASVAGERQLSKRERRTEALLMGLRQQRGIELRRFRERFGIDPMVEFAEPLRDPFDAKLLEVRDGVLRLTDRGMLLSNEVFQAFV